MQEKRIHKFMEILKKYPKSIQWAFLLIVFFTLCFSIDVPEGYKFIRAQAEHVKDPNQVTYNFWVQKLDTLNIVLYGDYLHYLHGFQFG